MLLVFWRVSSNHLVLGAGRNGVSGARHFLQTFEYHPSLLLVQLNLFHSELEWEFIFLTGKAFNLLLSVCHQMGGIALNLAGKVDVKKYFLQGGTIYHCNSWPGEWKIQHLFLFSEGKRRRLSCSVVHLCRVEDTSHEAVVGKLRAGASGSLMFLWARARLCRVPGCLLGRCLSALGGCRSSGSTWSTLRVLAVLPAPGLAMYTCAHSVRAIILRLRFGSEKLLALELLCDLVLLLYL